MPTCTNHSTVETDLTCASCARPMCQECLTSFEAEEGAAPRLLCPECLERERYAVRRAVEMETRDVNWAGAAIGGLVAGVVGAVVWYGIARFTGSKWSVVAILVGVVVGYGVMWGAGKKRGIGLQLAAGILALFSLLLGEYLILDYFVKDRLAQQGRSLGSSFVPLEFFIRYLQRLSFLTWAFIAGGAVVAFFIPKARKVPGGGAARGAPA